MANQYNEDQIQVLEGLEAVRKRPGMYIGDTYENGLHHLIWEIVDNSIDEHLAKRCDKISVTIHEDNSITVIDNGSGIPVKMHKTGRPTLEVVLTVLHAGGKFGGKESGYKVSGGLHGVGSSVVNALSERMVATVKRDGKIHQIEFSQGSVVKEIEVIGTCDPNDTGTKIWFKPDPLIFRLSTEYNFKRVYERLQQSAFLNEKLTITLTDEREKDSETNEPLTKTLFYERGLAQYVEFLNEKKEVLHDNVLYFNGSDDGIEIDVALQYHNGGDYDGIYSFVNNIKTPEDGTHVAGFKAAVTSTFKEYMTTQKLVKNNENIEGKDTLVGLTAIVSVKVEEAKLQFEGQTKSKLGTKEARPAVDKIVSAQLTRFLEENPQIGQVLASKVLQSYRIRMAAKRARELEKSKNEIMSHGFKPVKFKDCKIKDINDPRREVFFVEGDSAGGSAKGGRDREFQAIMPLRGKIRNTEKGNLEDFIQNEEIKSIVSIVGTGMLDEFNYDNLQYNKLVIMTDADVDGRHIAILMLTFFYRYMKPLIEKGHVYLANPPLYKFQVGKKIEYLYREDDLAKRLESHTGAQPIIQRYKGLGEMNPEQLWETTMDPSTRRLSQMTIDDADLVEQLFIDFMGKDATPRRDFLEKYGHEADIDV